MGWETIVEDDIQGIEIFEIDLLRERSMMRGRSRV